jgi:hypothetical protein
MPSDVEFISEQNGMIFKLKSKNIYLSIVKLEMNNYLVLSENELFQFFTYFTSKILSANISYKILNHISKDTEFYGEFFTYLKISAKRLLKIFQYFLVFFTVRVRQSSSCLSFQFCADKRELFEKQRQ